MTGPLDGGVVVPLEEWPDRTATVATEEVAE
jgi:hypothetical protein